jgi:hypothetical protein
MNCQEYWNTLPELGDPDGSRHLADCPACAARMDRQRQLQAGLRLVAAGCSSMAAPPRLEVRLRSAFRRHTGIESAAPAGRWLPQGGIPRRWIPRPWIPVVTWASAFAAIFALAVFLVRDRQPEAAHPPARHAVELAAVESGTAESERTEPRSDFEGFIPLPNSAGIATEEEEVNLVRVEVPRSAMIALGLEVNTDRAGELVEADVMLGADGIARAVRFLD